jgi:hypothetical protein
VRERYLEGDITIELIDGRKQLADLLTKPIECVRLEMLCSEIGIIPRNQCRFCDSVLEEVPSIKHCTLVAGSVGVPCLS